MRFKLLGPLVVERGGAELGIGGAKQQTVLTALLLARGNVVSTDRLVELVWGGAPPTKPYVTVRSYVSTLRRTLEPDRSAGDRARLLVTRSPGYAIDAEPSSIDVVDFEERVGASRDAVGAGRHQAAADLAAGALGLWRSDDLTDSPVASFAADAERLIELRFEVHAIRIDALLALGRHEEVIPDLGRLVDAEPGHDRFRGQLMLALYRAGRPAEAIELYQRGLRAAREQAGLELSPALADLERRILLSDPTLERPASEIGPFGRGSHEEGLDRSPFDRGATDRSIGRRAERDDAARVVEAGSGGLIVVTGEPGIGKTHLIDHLVELARSAGNVVLSATSHPDDGSTTLGPWRTVLLDLFAIVDDETAVGIAAGRGRELISLVPELADRLGIARSDGSRDLTTLTDAVARVVGGFSARRPLTLCFDDLHWSDPATIRLAAFIRSELVDKPVTLVVGWRDTELVDGELTAALAALGAAPDATRIELAGLRPGEVGDLWERLGGREPTKSEIDDLHRRTGGNPLFVTELVRVSPTAVPPTPTPTVQDAIVARLATLPPGCHDLLEIAALCPAGFTEAMLAELSGQPDDELLDNLEILLQTKILVDDPGAMSQFVFGHPVIGETLAGRMSQSRKARLHTGIARALDRQKASVGQLAHHYLQGVAVGEPAVAATSALRAARASAGLHDHRGAVDLLERALTVLDRSDDDLLRAELLVELAQETKYLEHVTKSHASAVEGYRLAKRAGNIGLMVRAAFVYCGQGVDEDRQGLQWLGYWNPPGPALEMLGECLDKLRSGPTRAAVLIAYAAQMFGEHHDPAGAMAALDEGVAEARAAERPALLATALHYRVSTLQRDLSIDEREQGAKECLALASANDLAVAELAAARDLMVVALDRNDPTAARRWASEGLAAVRRHDDPIIVMLAESLPVSLDIYEGRFDEAEAALAEAMARYERLGSAALDIFGIQFALLQRERGHLADVESMMSWKLAGYPGPAYAVALGLVLAEQGKYEEASAILADYGDESLLTGGEAILQFYIPAFHAAILAATGDTTTAPALYRELAPAAGRVVTLVNGLALHGSGSLYLGRLATLLGRFDEAAYHLAAADQHHTAVGARPFELRTILARAELAAAQGREDLVGRHLGDAGTLGDELSMGWLVANTEERLGR